jgi:hypothetical protein
MERADERSSRSGPRRCGRDVGLALLTGIHEAGAADDDDTGGNAPSVSRVESPGSPAQPIQNPKRAMTTARVVIL